MAYQDALSITPPMGTDDLINYTATDGARQVLRPKMKKKKGVNRVDACDSLCSASMIN